MLMEILQKLLALTFSFGFGLSSLQVLHQTFPQHTFLMNGLIHGVKVRNIPSGFPLNLPSVQEGHYYPCNLLMSNNIWPVWGGSGQPDAKGRTQTWGSLCS